MNHNIILTLKMGIYEIYFSKKKRNVKKLGKTEKTI